ncbi:hypothetical protein WN943_006478 [Citrus x changshan-huyou]
MEKIGVTKDYHCGYCATFGCWTLKKEVMAGLSWYVEYHLQGFERAFAVKSVVTSSCNCTFIQSTSMLGFQVLTLVRPRIRLAMEPLPLLLLCKEECELHRFEEVFAVNFAPRAIAAKRHIHSELSVTIPSVSTNALGYGAFIGLYANMRFQLLCGFDRAVTNHFEVIGVALIGQLKREERGWSGGRCLHKFVGVDVVNCPILLPVEETRHGSPHQTLRHLRNSMRWWYFPGVNFLASVVHR